MELEPSSGPIFQRSEQAIHDELCEALDINLSRPAMIRR